MIQEFASGLKSKFFLLLILYEGCQSKFFLREEKNKTEETVIRAYENCPDGSTFQKNVIAGKLCIKIVAYLEIRNTSYCCEGYFNYFNSCLPLCNPQCLHGTCIAPNQCDCVEGFSGSFCETTGMTSRLDFRLD